MAHILSASQALLTNKTTTNNTKGHNYTKDQVAMVMGLDPDHVPPIWTKCFSTTKNPDMICFHIKEQMQQWATSQEKIIDGVV